MYKKLSCGCLGLLMLASSTLSVYAHWSILLAPRGLPSQGTVRIHGGNDSVSLHAQLAYEDDRLGGDRHYQDQYQQSILAGRLAATLHHHAPQRERAYTLTAISGAQLTGARTQQARFERPILTQRLAHQSASGTSRGPRQIHTVVLQTPETMTIVHTQPGSQQTLQRYPSDQQLSYSHQHDYETTPTLALRLYQPGPDQLQGTMTIAPPQGDPFRGQPPLVFTIQIQGQMK